MCNLYVNAIGGVMLSEPATDLAVAVAIASSFFESEVASDTIVLGELGALLCSTCKSSSAVAWLSAWAPCPALCCPAGCGWD